MEIGDSLHRFLADQLPQGRNLRVSGLERCGGGASRETWAFDLHWQEDGGEREGRYILRRDPPVSLLETGLTTDRRHEFTVVRAVHGLGLPVPRMHWLDADGSYFGRPALIMERMSGQPTPPAFPASEDPKLRETVAHQFVDILARVHTAGWQSLGLTWVMEPPGPEQEAARRQVDLWQAVYEKDRLERHAIIEEAFLWLRTHLPSTNRIVLVHGDFRTGNYLYDETGITAFLDWELAHLGDPMEDLGWACMRFWSGQGLAGGLLPEEELFRLYEERSGIPVDRERVFFYKVLGNVKMAAIALSGVRAFCQGQALDVTYALVGFMVPRLCADIAEQIGL
ncbi:MAG: phosphotransferase family protein [Chloroflexi bacterium]|nr:phosphotransferase family protein [Chloroflexota bacterium]